jgi:hypothetical protein
MKQKQRELKYAAMKEAEMKLLEKKWYKCINDLNKYLIFN